MPENNCRKLQPPE